MAKMEARLGAHDDQKVLDCVETSTTVPTNSSMNSWGMLWRDSRSANGFCDKLSLHSAVYLTYQRHPIRVTRYFYSATHTAAIPIPVPTHMLVTPTFWPVRFNS